MEILPGLRTEHFRRNAEQCFAAIPPMEWYTLDLIVCIGGKSGDVGTTTAAGSLLRLYNLDDCI